MVPPNHYDSYASIIVSGCVGFLYARNIQQYIQQTGEHSDVYSGTDLTADFLLQRTSHSV